MSEERHENSTDLEQRVEKLEKDVKKAKATAGSAFGVALFTMLYYLATH